MGFPWWVLRCYLMVRRDSELGVLHSMYIYIYALFNGEPVSWSYKNIEFPNHLTGWRRGNATRPRSFTMSRRISTPSWLRFNNTFLAAANTEAKWITTKFMDSLVVWNMKFIFPYVGNFIIPIDELMFFRGVDFYHHQYSYGRWPANRATHWWFEVCFKSQGATDQGSRRFTVSDCSDKVSELFEQRTKLAMKSSLRLYATALKSCCGKWCMNSFFWNMHVFFLFWNMMCSIAFFGAPLPCCTLFMKRQLYHLVEWFTTSSQ